LEFTYKGGLILGFLGAINLVFVGYSIPPSRVPGSLQSIVSQCTMPFTVISSMLFLGRNRFPSIRQWFGVAIVIAGLCVVVIPDFMGGIGGGDPFWITSCIIGNAVLGPSAVLFERTTRNRHTKKQVISAWFAVGIQSLWSTVFLWAALPLNFTSKFGGTSPSEFWKLMDEAFLCTWTGYNGYVDPNNDLTNICHNLWLVIILLLIDVALYNTIAAYMETVDTANYTQIANCIGGVFSTYYFFIPYLSGITYEKFDTLVFLLTSVAMVLIVVGTIIYKSTTLEENHNFESNIEFLMITSNEQEKTMV